MSYKDAYGRLERRVRSGDAAVRALTARSLRDPDEVVQWLDSQGHIMSVSAVTRSAWNLLIRVISNSRGSADSSLICKS